MANDLTTILVERHDSPGYIVNRGDIEESGIICFIKSQLFSKITGWVLLDHDDPEMIVLAEIV